MNTFKKVGVMTVIAAVVLPVTIAFAGFTQHQFFGNYYLGAMKEQYLEINENDGSLKYQNNNVTVSNLVHDGDANNCSFCKLEITGKKKGFLGIYGKIGSNTINTPRTGTYGGANYGDVGTGTFRYYIKNNGAFQNDGTIRVNAQNSY